MPTLHCRSTEFTEITTIFFDKDGTLADSETFLRLLAQRRSRLIDAQVPGVQEPLMLAFGVEGDRINPMGMMALGTRRENEIAAAAYVAETGRGWIEALELVAAAFKEADRSLPRKADETLPFPGVDSLLSRLCQAGFTLGVLSSDSTEQVCDFLDRHHLTSYFAIALGSDDRLSKPQAAFYHHACQQLGVLPQQTLVIGDAQSDILMARSGGAAGCIGVTWGWSTPVQLNDATVQISCIEEIRLDEF